MRIAATSVGGVGRFALALALWLSAWTAGAHAQFFNFPPPRPPGDVPGATPGAAQDIAPPGAQQGEGTAPKGPMLQSLPPNRATPPSSPPSPAIPAGHAALVLSARFGRE